MAKKGGSKGNGIYDYYNLTPDQKQKICQVHDVFQDVKKENVAVVLQYYDYDEVKAIDAFTFDGGAAALNSWVKTGNSQIRSINKTKKRNKKKNKKENGPAVSSLATGTDADDSSSLHSSNIDLGEKESNNKAENWNDTEQPLKIDQETKVMCDRVVDMEYVCCELSERENPLVRSQVKIYEEPKMQRIFKQDVNSEPQNCNVSHSDLNKDLEVNHLEWSDSIPEIKHDQTVKEERSKSGKEGSHQNVTHKTSQRQRHGSFHHSKTTSVTEECTFQTAQISNAPKKGGFEKCKKDLMRQSVSLQRIQNQMENGLEDSNKRMKNIFLEIRKLLDKRQREVEEEMERVKHEALNLLKNRQDLSSELKRRVDRLPSMNESEWNELRSDIKQFVMERKYDEELGKTIWFHWSVDGITEAINNLGEVTPVRNVYCQRLHAGFSHSGSQSNSAEPSPSSVPADDEMKTLSGKTDEENTLESGVNEAKLEQDLPPIKPQSQGENRPRIFSSRRYSQPNFGGRHPPNHNSRGRAYRWRSNVGGNYPRVRHYESHRQFGERHNEYRQQQSQERTEYYPTSEDKELDSHPVAEDVSNGTSTISHAAFKEINREPGKNHDRGHYGGYRQQHRSFNHYGRSRAASKNPRSNPENVPTGTDPVTDRNSNYEDQSSQQKSDVVNGFVSHQ